MEKKKRRSEIYRDKGKNGESFGYEENGNEEDRVKIKQRVIIGCAGWKCRESRGL